MNRSHQCPPGVTRRPDAVGGGGESTYCNATGYADPRPTIHMRIEWQPRHVRRRTRHGDGGRALGGDQRGGAVRGSRNGVVDRLRNVWRNGSNHYDPKSLVLE